VVQVVACAASFYAHVFFDKEYHVEGSQLQRFAWFRRKQELHFVHHRHACSRYPVVCQLRSATTWSVRLACSGRRATTTTARRLAPTRWQSSSSEPISFIDVDPWCARRGRLGPAPAQGPQEGIGRSLRCPRGPAMPSPKRETPPGALDRQLRLASIEHESRIRVEGRHRPAACAQQMRAAYGPHSVLTGRVA
jgi:hypothetical protein